MTHERHRRGRDRRVPIQTARLRLRWFTDDDFDALYSMYSREDVSRWLYWEPRNEEQIRESLAKKIVARGLEKPGDTLSLAAELGETGEVVADLVLHWHDDEHRQGEIGFVVHPDHQGHAYATEASEELLRIAFDDVRLHRVIGRAEARNAASARTLEKLRMRREAHLVENEYVKGEWQSEVVYAILEREWRSTS